jgi:hypothetical protein
MQHPWRPDLARVGPAHRRFGMEAPVPSERALGLGLQSLSVTQSGPIPASQAGRQVALRCGTGGLACASRPALLGAGGIAGSGGRGEAAQRVHRRTGADERAQGDGQGLLREATAVLPFGV